MARRTLSNEVGKASSLSSKKKKEAGKMPVPYPKSLPESCVVYCGENLE
jgi:hypothetical protein